MRFASVSDLKKRSWPLWREAGERSVLRMSGADRLRWLNGLVTCNVETPSAERYGLLCEKKGKIEADFHHVSTPEALYLVVPTDRLDAVYTILEHHLIMEDVELTREESLGVVWHYTANGVSAGPLTLRDGEISSVTVPLRGIGGESALTGVLSLVKRDHGAAPTRAGIPVGGDPSAALTDDEWRALRVFSGIAEYGPDFDATMYPQEAALEDWAVAFDKGCYMGQEVVFMMQNRGHARRRLVTMQGAGLSTGAELFDAEIGDETRAIALVKSTVAKPGAVLGIGDAKVTVLCAHAQP
jgi:folate-binding protein YgfZ